MGPAIPTSGFLKRRPGRTGVAALQAALATSTDPRPSQDGVRALLFAKGLGKPDGDAISWHVEVRRRRVFANGTDLQGLPPR